MSSPSALISAYNHLTERSHPCFEEKWHTAICSVCSGTSCQEIVKSDNQTVMCTKGIVMKCWAQKILRVNFLHTSYVPKRMDRELRFLGSCHFCRFSKLPLVICESALYQASGDASMASLSQRLTYACVSWLSILFDLRNNAGSHCCVLCPVCCNVSVQQNIQRNVSWNVVCVLPFCAPSTWEHKSKTRCGGIVTIWGYWLWFEIWGLCRKSTDIVTEVRDSKISMPVEASTNARTNDDDEQPTQSAVPSNELGLDGNSGVHYSLRRLASIIRL